MPKGQSGRIVIEVDPDLKRRLYAALAGDNSTLKDWFLSEAASYLADQGQPSLPDLIHKKRSGAKRK
jgi:hypothetical protein